MSPKWYATLNDNQNRTKLSIGLQVMAKMWLHLYHPLGRADGGTGVPPQSKGRLFRTSIDMIHHSRVLASQKETIKWSWLFRSYIQWHAIAFILSELCVRTRGQDVEDAWVAIDGVFEEWGGTVAAGKKGMLWKPMRRLIERARATRQREIEKSVFFPTDGTLGPVETGQVATTMRMSSMKANGNLGGKPFSPVLPISPVSLNSLNYNNEQLNTSAPLMNPTTAQSFGTAPNNIYMNASPQSADQWMFNENANQSPLAHQQQQFMRQHSDTSINDEEVLNWSGWDDMVKDFQMDMQQEQGLDSGPVISGMGDWW